MRRFFKAIWNDLVQIVRDPLGLDAELTALEAEMAAHLAECERFNAENEAWLREFTSVEYIGTEGSMRVVLPPEATEVIARQRDAVTTTNRKRAGRQQAAARKAAGLQPGFLKGKKPKAKSPPK